MLHSTHLFFIFVIDPPDVPQRKSRTDCSQWF